MTKFFAFLFAFSLLTVVSGCASDFEESYREPSQFEIKAPGDTLTMTGDQRAIFIRPMPGDDQGGHTATNSKGGGSTVLCAEPVPDVALSSLAKISGKLAASADAAGDVAKPSVNAEYANELTVTAGALAGRNSTVLLTRDLMYRLCELSANYRPGSEEYKSASQNFKQILEAVVTLAKADKAEADAKNTLAKVKVDILSDKAWPDALPPAAIRSEKIKLIVAKASDNGKISVARVNDMMAKAEKEPEKFSADGKQKVTTGAASAAANDDARDFSDALINVSDSDLEALWKAAQKL